MQETAPLPEQVTLEPPHERPWRIAGEVLRTYIICEDEQENVWLIDKHAAHERVRFDALKAAAEPVMTQTLLEPLAVELPPEDCAAVLEQLPLLERYGFRCEDFGGAVLVREVPGDIDDPAALEELAEGPAAEPGTRTRPGTACCPPWPANPPSRPGCTPTPPSCGVCAPGPVRGDPVLPPWPSGGGEAQQIPGGEDVQAGVTARERSRL